jgi:tetratricopeptide (TPR) repeat protein
LPEIFDNADKRLPRLTVDRARGLWLADQAERRSDPAFAARAVLLLSAVAKHLSDDADVLDALGTASAVSGRFDDSLTYWKKALAIEPRREETLRTMALLLHNSGRPDAALPYLEKYLQLQPWDASMWGRYSHILGRSGMWDRAIEAAKKSEEFDPSQPRVYQWLSEAYKRVGDEKRSRHYADVFERMKRQSAK